jgi:hypothetical protein
VPTVPDPIAEMLADEAWRLKVEGRFWPKVMRPMGWDQCWPWTASKDLSGYGHFKLKSYVDARASRVSYALYYNASPGKLFVCHTCDNPGCVNPLHLFLGTCQDNSTDMVRKGRWRGPPDAKGENNGAAKLTAAQVATIRELIRLGLSNTAIAQRFAVTHQLISKIRRGRAWGEAPMMEPYRRSA